MPISVYAPLVAYIAGHEENQLFLTFDQLEAILEMTLSRTARTNHGYWTSAAYRHVADLERAGWEAHLHVDVQTVEFRRLAVTG